MSRLGKPWRSTPEVKRRARELREALTPAEAKLWAELQRWEEQGYVFLPQHPCGPYILDFVCPRAGLVIEVDGDTHEQTILEDTFRSVWLHEHMGYRVVRFSNQDVYERIPWVLGIIRAELLIGTGSHRKRG